MSSTASILWRGKYLILAGIVCGLLGAVLVTHMSAKVYEATTLIQVQSDTSTAGAAPLDLQQVSQDLATTYSTLITSRSFLARIRSHVAGGRYSTGDLASRINATAITQNTQNTNLIELTAQGSNPDAAALLAGQVAQAFVTTLGQDAATRARLQQQQLESTIQGLTAQIDRLETRPSSLAAREQIASLKAQRGALTNQLANTIATAVSQQGSVDIVAPATASSAPVKPRPHLNDLIGLVLGLLVGIGLAWLRSLLDRELHSSDEVEELVNLPVLASIPLRRGATADDLVTREAYEVLRTNLTFLSLEYPLNVVTVTSYESGEGKSATAEGLANAAARRDLKVLLVDGDVRTAQLSRRLGAGDRPGLVNLAVHRGDPRFLDSMVREIRPGLWLLPAGPPPPNPPSVLSGQRMAELMTKLRERYELIVIDSPPVGHLSDAAILAGLSDAAILVARVGMTKKDGLVGAMTALSRTPTPVVGVAVFDRRSVDSSYYASTAAEEEKREPAAPRKGILGAGKASSPAPGGKQAPASGTAKAPSSAVARSARGTPAND